MGYAVTAADASVRVAKTVEGAKDRTRVLRDTCPRCGAVRDLTSAPKCGHSATKLSSRLHIANGIIR